MNDWRDDPDFKQIVIDAAFEIFEKNKDNPYAAVGLAHTLAALNGNDKERERASRLMWESPLSSVRRFAENFIKTLKRKS